MARRRAEEAPVVVAPTGPIVEGVHDLSYTGATRSLKYDLDNLEKTSYVITPKDGFVGTINASQRSNEVIFDYRTEDYGMFDPSQHQIQWEYKATQIAGGQERVFSKSVSVPFYGTYPIVTFQVFVDGEKEPLIDYSGQNPFNLNSQIYILRQDWESINFRGDQHFPPEAQVLDKTSDPTLLGSQDRSIEWFDATQDQDPLIDVLAVWKSRTIPLTEMHPFFKIPAKWTNVGRIRFLFRFEDSRDICFSRAVPARDDRHFYIRNPKMVINGSIPDPSVLEKVQAEKMNGVSNILGALTTHMYNRIHRNGVEIEIDNASNAQGVYIMCPASTADVVNVNPTQYVPFELTDLQVAYGRGGRFIPSTPLVTTVTDPVQLYGLYRNSMGFDMSENYTLSPPYKIWRKSLTVLYVSFFRPVSPHMYEKEEKIYIRFNRTEAVLGDAKLYRFFVLRFSTAEITTEKKLITNYR